MLLVAASCLLLLGVKIIERVHFVRNVKHIFLSVHACKTLNIIHSTFPHLPKTDEHCQKLLVSRNIPVRRLPDQPNLPFAVVEENLSKLENWLLNHFKDTVFNVNASPSPVISGEMHHIHLKPAHQLYAVHSPIPLPHH